VEKSAGIFMLTEDILHTWDVDTVLPQELQCMWMIMFNCLRYIYHKKLPTMVSATPRNSEDWHGSNQQLIRSTQTTILGITVCRCRCQL